MLTAYAINPNATGDSTDDAGIILVDLVPGSPTPAPTVKVVATADAAPNTVQSVDYLDSAPVKLTLKPGAAVGDQIAVLVRSIGGPFSITDSTATGPVLYDALPPLNEQRMFLYKWSGSAWSLAK